MPAKKKAHTCMAANISLMSPELQGFMKWPLPGLNTITYGGDARQSGL